MVYDRCDSCKNMKDANAPLHDGDKVNETSDCHMTDANAPLDDGNKVNETSGCFCHDIASLVFKVCMDNVVYKIV